VSATALVLELGRAPEPVRVPALVLELVRVPEPVPAPAPVLVRALVGHMLRAGLTLPVMQLKWL